MTTWVRTLTFVSVVLGAFQGCAVNEPTKGQKGASSGPKNQDAICTPNESDAASLRSEVDGFEEVKGQGLQLHDGEKTLTYEEVIKPIVVAKCTGCHSEAADEAQRMQPYFTSLDGVKSNWEKMLTRMRNGTMPPQGAPVSVNREDIASFSAWVAAGMPGESPFGYEPPVSDDKDPEEVDGLSDSDDDSDDDDLDGDDLDDDDLDDDDLDDDDLDGDDLDGDDLDDDDLDDKDPVDGDSDDKDTDDKDTDDKDTDDKDTDDKDTDDKDSDAEDSDESKESPDDKQASPPECLLD